MPPRHVLSLALGRVFGDKVGHQEIVTALLGGSGRDPDARDTAVSKRTTANVRLQRIDESTCLTELTWTHEFSGVRNNHLLVMFATWDRDIYTSVIQERTYPLFEIWRVLDEDALDQFVPGLKDRLDVGITYRERSGSLHDVGLRSVDGEEVAFRHYDRFVRLPDWVDRKNLAIYQVDLHDLADPDHIVDSVESLDASRVDRRLLRPGIRLLVASASVLRDPDRVRSPRTRARRRDLGLPVGHVRPEADRGAAARYLDSACPTGSRSTSTRGCCLVTE